jgi:EpsI family protein
MLVALLLLLTIGARFWLLRARTTTVQEHPLNLLPEKLGHWQMLEQPRLTADVLSVLAADDYLLRIYRNPSGAQAELFAAYYASQKAGESMHSPKNCLPGAGWEPVYDDYIPLDSNPTGKPAQINRFVIQNGNDRSLVLYWYQDQGHIVANEYWGKIMLVWNALRTGRRDGAIIRVTVPMDGRTGVDAATQEALSLVHASLPALDRLLPQ